MPILIDATKLLERPENLSLNTMAVWQFAGNPRDCMAFFSDPRLSKDQTFVDIKRAVEAAYPERADDIMRTLELNWKDAPIIMLSNALRNGSDET